MALSAAHSYEDVDALAAAILSLGITPIPLVRHPAAYPPTHHSITAAAAIPTEPQTLRLRPE